MINEIKVMTNKELAEMLIVELQETIKEDYFTGKFLDLVGEYLVPQK